MTGSAGSGLVGLANVARLVFSSSISSRNVLRGLYLAGLVTCGFLLVESAANVGGLVCSSLVQQSLQNGLPSLFASPTF